MNRALKGLLLVAALGLAAPAFAQKGALEVRSEAMKEVPVAGAASSKDTRLVAATHAAPGDEIVYVTTIRNTGKAPAEKLVVNNPVPPELLYAGALGDNAQALVSVDNKTFDVLDRLIVTGADGSKQPATTGDVRFVRWTLNGSLKPGETTTVSYRAILK